MREIRPHTFFQLDFEQILDEGKRQEAQLKANAGEFKINRGMFIFFSEIVIPLIKSDDWVYDAALRFASDFALDCFNIDRLTGNEISQSQNKISKLKGEVQEIVHDAKKAGYLKYFIGPIELEKASDFKSLLLIKKMNRLWRTRVEELYARVTDEENLGMLSVLRAIRDTYEINLPRIMFVVKRAIKVADNIPKKTSDNLLVGISEDMSWYERYLTKDHPLFPVLGYISSFYKPARNVANHHKGFTWVPEENIIVLEDESRVVRITSIEYVHKMRYLIYLCEFGLRGILSGFCEREHGKMSNNLVVEYNKIFTEDNENEEKVKVIFY